jgi:two-component system aerobic respiration control sensor histidine kinase ArcB
VTLFLRGTVDIVDLVRSVFFGLLVTPWAVYFLSIVVDQLEDSRQRLTRMVRKLQDMRERDLELNSQLQENISRLNAQIAETNRAETLRQQAIEDLENEVFQREKAQLHLGERTALLRSFIDCSPIWSITATRTSSSPVATAPWRSSPARWKRNSSA